MALDLIRIVLYADSSGALCSAPQRKFFSIVDGIIGGESEGPLGPTAKQCGVVLAGFNPLATDAVATRLMGFDVHQIKMLAEGFARPWLNLWGGCPEAIPVASNVADYASLMSNECDPFLKFQPQKGWRGRIEIGPKGNGHLPPARSVQR